MTDPHDPSQKPDVLVVGAGTMGAPMASRLALRGFSVSVFDADPARTSGLRGVPGVGIVDAITGPLHGVCLLMLPDSDAVEWVMDGPGGLGRSVEPGSLIIDMGSSRPESTRRLSARFAPRVSFFDAPVSGGPVRAAEGDLAIMAGAPDDETFERALPVLDALGHTYRTGGVGTAHAMKALNNLLSASGLISALEVLAIGTAAGLEPSIMLDVLNASTGRNHATEVKILPHVIREQWNVGFSLGLTVKDLRTALAIADEEGVPARVARDVLAVAEEALVHLGPGADQSEIARLILPVKPSG